MDFNDKKLVHELRKQLRTANEALENKLVKENQSNWPSHNKGHKLKDIYDLLSSNDPEKALNLIYSLNDYDISGEKSYLEGICYLKLKNFYKSIICLDNARKYNFVTPYLEHNQALAYIGIGNDEKSIIHFDMALKLLPSYSECRYNYALFLLEKGRTLQAETHFILTLIHQINYFKSSFELGNIYRKDNKLDKAISSYELCLRYNPRFIEAILNLGLCYELKNNYNIAIGYYSKCLILDENFLLARLNLVLNLIKNKEYDTALPHVKYLDKKLLNCKERVRNKILYITVLLNLDKYDEALSIANSEKNKISRLLARINVLPIIYKSQSELNLIRERWVKDLNSLYKLTKEENIDYEYLEEINSFLWETSNFFLCYQMKNDKIIQKLYCDILERILRKKYDPLFSNIPIKKGNFEKIRIGVISPHLYNHNGANWAPGLLQEIIKDSKYQIITYNLSEREDHITNEFASFSVYKKLRINQDNFIESIEVIKNDHLDILIFTDIGMHPISKILSVTKLASIQINCWGHPVTSGSKYIDYYLSSMLMETEESKNHYSEELILLPSIGLNYQVPKAPNDGQYLFEKFKIPRSRPLLSSMQSDFKYIPENDSVFAEISNKNRNALIIFVEGVGNKLISENLIKRISLKYKELDLNINDHVLLLPRLEHSDYIGMLKISHHSLDTINHNGGNSSLQALSVDCPVLTYPTEFMRGRHTVGMLNEMGVTELIATSRENYINISSRLLSDLSFYLDIKGKISQNKNKLFNNNDVSSSFKEFIESKCFPRSVNELN